MEKNYTDNIESQRAIDERSIKHYDMWKRKDAERGYDPYRGNVIKVGRYQINETKIIQEEEQQETNWEEKINGILAQSDVQDEIEKLIAKQNEQKLLLEKIRTENISGQDEIERILEKQRKIKEDKERLLGQVLQTNNPQTNINKMLKIDDDAR